MPPRHEKLVIIACKLRKQISKALEGIGLDSHFADSTSASQLLVEVKRLTPGIVIIDIVDHETIPGLCTHLLSTSPNCHVVACSAEGDRFVGYANRISVEEIGGVGEFLEYVLARFSCEERHGA